MKIQFQIKLWKLYVPKYYSFKIKGKTRFWKSNWVHFQLDSKFYFRLELCNQILKLLANSFIIPLFKYQFYSKNHTNKW